MSPFIKGPKQMDRNIGRQKYALLSVFNKDGINMFAEALIELGFKIISSGGTKKYLSEKGVEAMDVAEITGMPAILGHRLVTIHPKIIGGLLARDCEEHDAEREKHSIPWIDLLCVDLYPLADAIKEGKSDEEILESVDVGGPNMLAAASKGRRIVICDLAYRQKVIDWLKEGCLNEEEFLQHLGAKADSVVAKHRLDSARYFGNGEFDGMLGTRVAKCKGENGLQQAALYSCGTNDPLALDKLKQLDGAPLSFINWCDADRAVEAISTIERMFVGGEASPIAIGMKHGNACGASVGFSKRTKDETVSEMIKGDSEAIFGGTVIVNFTIDAEHANILVYEENGGTKRILDVVIAPSFTDQAQKILHRKSGRCRMLINPALGDERIIIPSGNKRRRPVRGGFLSQDDYQTIINWWDHPELECHGVLTPNMIQDLTLAIAIGSRSNSNTVTIVKDAKLIGNGTGQQSRVGAAKLAISRAKDRDHKVKGAVASTDSFFPFVDGPYILAKAGVIAVFATRGSIRDAEVVAAFKETGVVFVTLPDDIARGFCYH